MPIPDRESVRSSTPAEVALINRISAVPTILQLVCEMTGMGFATVARVTGTSWVACAVLDKIGFGLEVGGKLDVATTLCREIHDSREPIVIEKASEDTTYCGHLAPQQYGFESYIAVPIVRRSGEFFGTICALDPKPATLSGTRVLPTLRLFAELVAAQIELEEHLDKNESALVDATEVGVLREQFIAVLGHEAPLGNCQSSRDIACGW